VTPKLPVTSAKELVRVAEKLGFVFRRQSGSHAMYVRASDKARVVIPGRIEAENIAWNHPRPENKRRRICQPVVRNASPASGENYEGILARQSSQ
jgi:predicted RNA binding protein YcfA (HicA-like mRNA interferase family)